jgi:hypothetical protein
VKLQVFQSDKGDCLLLTAKNGKRMLIDGGMRDAYQEHVATALGDIAAAGGDLDLVYLSHVDQDHIAGVLQLMEDHVAWKVHDFQVKSGNDRHPEPDRPRPPKVLQLWHNPFHRQVDANLGAIEDMLAQTAVTLEAGDRSEDPELALLHRELGASIGEAIQLTRRVSPEQLDIAVNKPFGNELIMVRDGQRPIRLGSVRLTVIGPFKEDLERFRKEWNTWLGRNKKELARIDARMRGDEERLGMADAERLRAAMELRASELGDRSAVTAPNLASVMLLAEEAGKTILLTGDGHGDDVLRGLEHAGRVTAGGGLHVDVLKVQHHGAEHNIDPEFCRRISADNYVFCGNGKHQNPDLRALAAIIDSHLGSDRQRSRNPGADGAFKLWFNSNSGVVTGGAHTHMQRVEKLVAERAAGSGGRMTASFLDDHSFELEI